MEQVSHAIGEALSLVTVHRHATLGLVLYSAFPRHGTQTRDPRSRARFRQVLNCRGKRVSELTPGTRGSDTQESPPPRPRTIPALLPQSRLGAVCSLGAPGSSINVHTAVTVYQRLQSACSSNSAPRHRPRPDHSCLRASRATPPFATQRIATMPPAKVSLALLWDNQE